MSTPIFNGNNNQKNKRIHLSPLAPPTDANFTNLRYRDRKLPKDGTSASRRSISLQNLSVSDDKTLSNLHQTQSVPRLTYDDRFIPRPIRDVPIAQAAIIGHQEEAIQFTNQQINNLVEGAQEKYEKMRACVSEPELNEERILKFSKPLPKGHECGIGKAVDFVRTSTTKPVWKSARFVPKTVERVLDAPELINDYYLNVLHWGGDNRIAVGLGSSAYIWNANAGNINKIEPSNDQGASDYVSSVRWSGCSTNSCLAIGYSSGVTKLYDIRTSKCLRTLTDSSDRVPSLSWNENILSCGSRRGAIVNYDVRVQHAKISALELHTQEVCGLAWSSDGQHLASGGNDNNVFIWEKTGVVSNGPILHNFVYHTAAVKAVAWHPREPNILATGGGTSDHTLNFWNVYNGSHLRSLPTNSQISGIVWNPRVNEFVTSHGHPQNQLTLWNYPSMEISAHLISHTNRVLAVTLSPDGTTVASVGADETLRLWKCFEAAPKQSHSRGRDIDEKMRITLH